MGHTSLRAESIHQFLYLRVDAFVVIVVVVAFSVAGVFVDSGIPVAVAEPIPVDIFDSVPSWGQLVPVTIQEFAAEERRLGRIRMSSLTSDTG